MHHRIRSNTGVKRREGLAVGEVEGGEVEARGKIGGDPQVGAEHLERRVGRQGPQYAAAQKTGCPGDEYASAQVGPPDRDEGRGAAADGCEACTPPR